MASRLPRNLIIRFATSGVANSVLAGEVEERLKYERGEGRWKTFGYSTSSGKYGISSALLVDVQLGKLWVVIMEDAYGDLARIEEFLNKKQNEK